MTMVSHSPRLGKLIQKGSYLIDADCDIAWIVQPLSLCNAFENIGEVADQLAVGNGDPWFWATWVSLLVTEGIVSLVFVCVCVCVCV